MAGREGYAYCIGTGRPAAGEKKRKEDTEGNIDSEASA